MILSSVCLSVRLSVTLCICGLIKQYILQQKVSEQVNMKCRPRNTTAFNPSPTRSPQTPPPKKKKFFFVSNSYGQHADVGYCRHRSVATLYEEEHIPVRYVIYNMLTWRKCISRDIVYMLFHQRCTIGYYSNSCVSRYFNERRVKHDIQLTPRKPTSQSGGKVSPWRCCSANICNIGHRVVTAQELCVSPRHNDIILPRCLVGHWGSSVGRQKTQVPCPALDVRDTATVATGNERTR